MKSRKNELACFSLHVKVLRNDNFLKGKEIQSLPRRLNLLTNNDETHNTSVCTTISDPQIVDHKAVPDNSENPIFDGTEASNIAKPVRVSLMEENEDDINNMCVDEPQNFSTLEEKIRMDIDDLLKENIEILFGKKFQASVDDLQVEVAKLKEKKQDRATKNQQSDIHPIYRNLREL